MLDKLKYRKPNFNREWLEANRYPEFQDIGKSGWLKLAPNGSVVRYSNIKDVLGNVNLDFDSLEKDKKQRFIEDYKTGVIEVPIAVKFNDFEYDLLGGNTRLAGLIRIGHDPKIWVVQAPGWDYNDSEESLDEEIAIEEDCWDGYKQVGGKMKNGKMVPNCVPTNESTEEINEGENQPTNPSLWSRAKSLAKSKFDVYPSAYANGWAAKWYKSKGGGWKKKKKTKNESTEELSEDLRRWFKEKWVDVSKKVDGKHPPCGRKDADGKSYPKCRPSKKVSKDTPKVASSYDKDEKKAMTQQKRRAEKEEPKVGKGNKPTMTHFDEMTGAVSAGAFSAPMSFTKKDLKEAMDAGISAAAAFDVPLFGATTKGGRKDPLKIDGPESIGKSRAVKDKSFPKFGGPGGIFIKIKDKCKKFPYCNQGDINAIEILRETIEDTAKKHGLPIGEVEKIVLKGIKDIFI
jgi:hypothetical protein